MSKTIGMTPLKDFVKYGIYTGFVKNAPYPVSELIIAPPEHAKSTEVRKFECLGVIQVDKATAFGLAELIQRMSRKDLEIYHHFVILDLENYASMGTVVKEQFLSLVRQTSAEGIKSYHTGRINLELEERKSFGFIMCTTPEDLGDKRSVFRSLSFLSRPLPWTYKYSDSMKTQILAYIAKEEHNAQECEVIKREQKAKVELPVKYSDKLNPYAIMLARRVERIAHLRKTVFSENSNLAKFNDEELCGIRAKENLMTFLKAIALYSGRTTVIRQDMEELERLYRWMNFKFNDIDVHDG